MAASASATRCAYGAIAARRRHAPPSRLARLAWDPHTRPIVTEYTGTVKFENEEGVTVAKQIDE